MSIQHTSQTTQNTTPAVGVIQRKCDCGAKKGVEGSCPDCEKSARLGQESVRLGPQGDSYEKEADHVADSVVTGTPVPRIHGMAESKGEEAVQAKSVGPPAAFSPVTRAADAVRTGGAPLGSSVRSDFEPHFGRSLADVRIHTGTQAQNAARGINASAYTHRNNIAFAPGQYAPSTQEGRHLLAHELTHTIQQGRGRTIRRTCPADLAKIPKGGSKKFEQNVDELKDHKRYKGLVSKDKTVANHIIDGARGSDCPMYYISELTGLFDTQRRPKAKTEAKQRKQSVDAEIHEEKKMEESKKHEEKTGKPLIDTGIQERTTRSKDRVYKVETGENGKTFRIDDRDPANVFVHMKVRVTKQGSATDKDRDRVEKLEDAIERQAATKGYMLDLEFVREDGDDVFTVHVDPSEWATAANWIKGPGTLAHEAHHLLKLADRYNYIVSHARNVDMEIGKRLHWFREQMMRPVDFLSSNSMMRNSHSTNPLSEEDICALVQDDYRDCLLKRFSMRSADEIEKTAKPLAKDYQPQKAALLVLMSEAWLSRPLKERKAEETKDKADSNTPPASAFGNPSKVVPDAKRFPLKNPHSQKSGKDLERKSSHGFFDQLAGLFAGDEFSEKELKHYLRDILGDGAIEDFTDSDNKARAIVERLKWDDDLFGFKDTGALRALLIQEMQSGFTGNDDERAILWLLTSAEDAQLKVIFGTGGVTPKSLDGDFQGNEQDQLDRFLETRFEGGRAAVEKGVVAPQRIRSGFEKMTVSQAKARLAIVEEKLAKAYSIDMDRQRNLLLRQNMDATSSDPGPPGGRADMEGKAVQKMNRKPIDVNVLSTGVVFKVRFHVRFEDPKMKADASKLIAALKTGISEVWDQTFEEGGFEGQSFSLEPEIVEVKADAVRDERYWLVTVRPTDTNKINYPGCKWDTSDEGVLVSVTNIDCEGGVISVPPAHVENARVLGHETLHLFGLVDRYMLITEMDKEGGKVTGHSQNPTRQTAGRADPLGGEHGTIMSEDLAYVMESQGVYDTAILQRTGGQTIMALEREALKLRRIIELGRNPDSLIKLRTDFNDKLPQLENDL